MANVTVIGAGAFGTSLALYCDRIKHNVKVWAFENEVIESVKEQNENTIFLPGFNIPESIKFSNDYQEALADAELVLIVCPSAFVRSVITAAEKYIPKNALIVSAAKGIEHNTLAFMSDVLENTIDPEKKRTAFLSGPSFAKDIASGLPANLACASYSIDIARKVQDIVHSPYLRIYASDDVVGVELGGALKNIIAVACGAADGLGNGASARASLITRGLAEISRLGVALGARPITFSGLAGVGDLILTCTTDLSRNRTLGLKLAKGMKAAEILSSQKAVAEGYVTVKPVQDLAQKAGTEIPICRAVYNVCYKDADIKAETLQLMEREKKDEFFGLIS